jgi:nucleoside phosphorylase
VNLVLTVLDGSMIDYLIVTPTDEEFKQLREAWFGNSRPGKQIGSITYYIHRHRCDAGEALIVALSMGRMGQSWAGLIAYEAARLWLPISVIQVGIAGRLPKGPPKGDVVVPGYVLGYEIASVDSIEGQVRFKFRPTGDRPELSLLNSARAFYNHPRYYQDWRSEAYQQSEERLQNAGVSKPPTPEIHVGEKLALASGNFVVRTDQFGTDLQEFSSDLRAVEMEAKGLLSAIELLDAIQTGRPVAGTPSALLVRGISDDADVNKEKEDARTGGVYRTTSMRAATLFVKRLIEYRLANPGDRQRRTDPLVLNPKNSSNVPAKVLEMKLPDLGDNSFKWAFDPVFAVKHGSSSLFVDLKLIDPPPHDINCYAALSQCNDSGWMRYLPFERDKRNLTWKWGIDRSPENYSLSLGLVANRSIRFQLLIRDEFGRRSSWSSPKMGPGVP